MEGVCDVGDGEVVVVSNTVLMWTVDHHVGRLAQSGSL